MGRFREALALQRDHALIARGVLVALDGESEMARAEQARPAPRRASAATRSASKRAKPRSRPGASKSTTSMSTGPSLRVCS